MKHTSKLLWPALLLVVLSAGSPTPLATFEDQDHDGYAAPADCDDWDAAIHPGATEICNFRDDDCDGQVDEGCKVYYKDGDGDGFGLWSAQRRAIEPPEHYSLIGGDCDDNNGSANPAAVEDCSTPYDDNCNGSSNEGCRTFYRDDDGDGWGNSAATKEAIIQPSGYVIQGSDCDDDNAGVNPGATEICDHIDNDCDGQVDEGCEPYYRDADKDGYGDINNFVRATSQPPGYVSSSSDCNDYDASIHPGATETCNFKDDNCNLQVDEGCTVFYRDVDGDGYGLWNDQTRAMTKPDGYSSIGGDCNDSDPKIHPGAAEECNGINDDCDGLTDEGCSGSSASEIKITAFPNPASNVFTVRLDGDRKNGKLSLRVTDHSGVVKEIKSGLEAGQTIKLGAGYPAGIYFIEAVQGRNRKLLRVVKS